MKKFLLGLVMGIGMVAHAAQVPVLLNDSTRSLNIKNFNVGRYPGENGNYVAYPFTAAANVTMGAVVDMIADTTVGFSEVSATTTISDQNVLGIVVGTTLGAQTGLIPQGATVFVATEGIVPVAFGAFATVTAGVRYSASGTAFNVTPVSATGIMTPSSRTAGIIWTMETKQTGPDGLAKGIIIR